LSKSEQTLKERAGPVSKMVLSSDFSCFTKLKFMYTALQTGLLTLL